MNDIAQDLNRHKLKSHIKELMSKNFGPEMYPELKKVGGLANAMNNEFERLGSLLRVVNDETIRKLPMTYARVENASKFSQIYIAAKEKLYLPDFWRDGACLAHGATDNISDLIKAIDYWLNQDISTQDLALQFSFVNPSDKAVHFDNNKEIEYAWNNLATEDDDKGLKEFIDVASKNEVLNKLFPFTSLYTLCFSKCTGYPYDSTGLPNVTMIDNRNFCLPGGLPENEKIQHENLSSKGRLYLVTIDRTQIIGKGDANEALKMVMDNLPNDIGPARKGIAMG